MQFKRVGSGNKEWGLGRRTDSQWYTCRLIGACAVVLGCMVFWGSFNPYLCVYLFLFVF